MHKHFFKHIITALLLGTLPACAQNISDNTMRHIYDNVKTPYKYGLVVAPQTNDEKFDCPTVFQQDGKWYMTYVRYNGKNGTDGRGYETWIAESDDLLNWNTLGRLLRFTDSGWDMNQHAGYPALIDINWGGSYEMDTFKGRHWMSYFGGVGTGYEAVNAPLSIGMSWTDDDITKAHQWTTSSEPVLAYNDKNAQWWETLTQYKSTVYKVDKHLFGKRFAMFYNAGGKDGTHPKGERIGIALSNDMMHWTRYAGNPVFAHDTDGTITGDAQIVKMDSVYVMFYFSAFNPTRDYHAFNTFAASRDLVHWQDWTGKDLIFPSKPYDEMFAHKSWVISHNGTVYHFYCAVDNAGQRGIALATSTPKGKSEINFPEAEPTGHRYSQTIWEPYNLDDYYGALQKVHGNLHGDTTFTKTFHAPGIQDKEWFLQFEGVGTYADITLNGQHLGRYDIGRTTETIDITKAVKTGSENKLEVKVSHPSGITDMPWVCGGCSSEWGFSEGSQPFGIFRPVTLIATDRVRVEPFGIHVWNNTKCDSIFIETEIKNYGTVSINASIINKLCERDGKQIARLTDDITLAPGETKIISQQSKLQNPHLWNTEKPYLYNVNTLVKLNGKAVDDVTTPYGIRTISWPLTRKDGDKRFMLNGKAVFINGVCEYEHEFGQSHAFSKEQIEARIKEVRDAGFNAFRDAHQPHNLYYKTLLDADGILWWPQFSAHIWFDSPQFRESFKRHLIQWVKERRNSPSLMLWGLQNESILPTDFAKECSDIIRKMDPTCGSQRLITTCNGGTGTDWNIVQNWSGTYGGNINEYGKELKRDDQLLNGEYGAWRTLGNHTGKGYTEEKYCNILRTKIEQAEKVKDSICGQFLWLLASHDNPGRRQPEEALRRIDKVGPFNNKGLFSIWEQPTDGYYLFKQKYNPDTSAILPHAIDDESILKPTTGMNYIYRINCGGDSYTDRYGNTWTQDNKNISSSWGDKFGVSSYTASQTSNSELPVSKLFKTSRFGRHLLTYDLPVENGDYQVELYFVEPWYGKENRENTDCEGLRIFDVAINDSTYIHDLDVWAQARYANPYKRVLNIKVDHHKIKVSFPKVKAGQAVISAIAIASKDKKLEHRTYPIDNPTMWADFDKDILVSTPDSILPPKTSNAMEAEGKRNGKYISWNFNVGVAKVYALRFRYYNPSAERKLRVKLVDKNGTVYKNEEITFSQTQAKKTKRKNTSITTGSMINAGNYTITISGEGINEMTFDKLTIE